MAVIMLHRIAEGRLFLIFFNGYCVLCSPGKLKRVQNGFIAS